MCLRLKASEKQDWDLERGLHGKELLASLWDSSQPPITPTPGHLHPLLACMGTTCMFTKPQGCMYKHAHCLNKKHVFYKRTKADVTNLLWKLKIKK